MGASDLGFTLSHEHVLLSAAGIVNRLSAALALVVRDEQPSRQEQTAMLDSVTLEGGHVRLEPISVDHIPGLVQAALPHAQDLNPLLFSGTGQVLPQFVLT